MCATATRYVDGLKAEYLSLLPGYIHTHDALVVPEVVHNLLHIACKAKLHLPCISVYIMFSTRLLRLTSNTLNGLTLSLTPVKLDQLYKQYLT